MKEQNKDASASTQASGESQGATASRSSKRVYRKPVVSDFGNVAALTRGGGTMGNEPMTGQKRTGM
jgi:hypothetical protein